MSSIRQTVWLDRGWQSAYIGFCPSEEAWRKMLAKLEIKEPCHYPPREGQDATTTIFRGTKHAALALVVTVKHELDHKFKTDPAGFAGLLAHEAVHVFQGVKEHMAEREASHEFEAYSIQHIFVQLMKAYSDTRVKKNGVRRGNRGGSGKRKRARRGRGR